jgi:short-subunit dehydrogenase
MTTGLRQRYGPWALIAGGSQGIGLSFARRLAASGINLILLARRTAPLQDAAAELAEEFDIAVVTRSLDLASGPVEAEVRDLMQDREIGLLIYNAGATHGAGLFHETDFSEAGKLVGLNCMSPLVLCHLLGGAMRKRRRGGIILLSSLSGLAGGGYIAAYAATKAFDIALAEGLWMELKPYGVDVLGLIAGATDTPAMRSSGADFAAYGATPMSADAVAEEGLDALGEGPLRIAGAGNRAFADVLRDGNRQPAMEAMTAGSAMLYGLPFPIAPDPDKSQER